MSSQFFLYSLGIAAENKPLDSRHLAVSLTEKHSALDGEITFNPEEKTFKGKDRNNQDYEVKVTEDMSLSAEWLPLGSNRVTPPDVRRGEPVAVYRLADTDQYYWRVMGLRDDLRRLETVIFAINANPNEGSIGLDPKNCYYLEWSSHQKLVTFQTSTANGEPFSYGMQFNTGSGEFTLEDDIGNEFYLDSARAFWELVNSDGTHLRLDKTKLYGFADDLIQLEAQSIHLKAGNDIRLEAGNSIYQSAPVHTTESTTVTVTAETHDVTAADSSYSGNLKVGANLSVAGGISMGSGGGGSMMIQGDCELQGAMEVTGEIRCRKLISQESIDAPNV